MASAETSDNPKNGVGAMSAEERQVYDRQIRLWGYDGQNKYVLITKLLNLYVFNELRKMVQSKFVGRT